MTKTRIYDSRRVVLLPTTNCNTDILLTGDGKYVHQERPTLVEGESFQFLYVVCDDDVSIGDWIINLYNHTDTDNNVYQIQDNHDIITYQANENWLKVIATNDFELDLPDVTHNFISNVIEQYNNNFVGEYANKVEFIDFILNVDIQFDYDDLYEFELVIAGNNKIITALDNKKLPKVKLYNREEVLRLINESHLIGYDIAKAEINGGTPKTIKEFIKEKGI